MAKNDPFKKKFAGDDLPCGKMYYAQSSDPPGFAQSSGEGDEGKGGGWGSKGVCMSPEAHNFSGDERA